MDGFTSPGYADAAGSTNTDAGPASQKGSNRMVSRVHTVALNGVDVLNIDFQVQLPSGMVAFNVVGLPDKAVAESRERVRAALAVMGLALPSKRIAVNLAPADVLAPASLLALVNHVKGTQVLTPPKPALAADDTPIPDTIPTRCFGSAYRDLVWALRMSDDFSLDFEGQAVRAFANLDAGLAQVGTDKTRLISV